MTQQLLRFRLYPATAQNPNTAATFRALHHFQLLSFESKCSVYEFHQTLVRESDNTSCRKVKVCKYYFRSVVISVDMIQRIAIRLFSKWFDNGVISECLKGLATGIFIMRQRKKNTHALCFVLPARNPVSTFPQTGSKPQRKKGLFIVYHCHEQNTILSNRSQSIAGSIRSSLLLMETLE